MQLHIVKVSKKDTDKNGNPYISKQGKPYSRASIQTREHVGEWLGGFWSEALREGAIIEADITEREYNGKMYKDFKILKAADVVSVEIPAIKEAILNLAARVTKLEQKGQEIIGF